MQNYGSLPADYYAAAIFNLICTGKLHKSSYDGYNLPLI